MRTGLEMRWAGVLCAVALGCFGGFGCEDGAEDRPSEAGEDAPLADVGAEFDGGDAAAGSADAYFEVHDDGAELDAVRVDAQPPCVPVEELCDGLDTDCDGLVDEGFEGLGEPCEAGAGECAIIGTWRCQSDGVPGCVPVEPGGTPVDEVCDGLDNDCDGVVDEVAETACYSGPPQTEGIGLCRGGVRACEDGTLAAACRGEILPEPERCLNTLDDDCDGAVDEGCECEDGQTQDCGVSEGICRPGVQRCVDRSWSACEGAVAPNIERCDGLDDDCNGRVDDGILGPECYSGEPGTEGVGACHGGSRACVDGQIERACSGEIVPAAIDVCDGIDGDCDGLLDEDHEDFATACGLGVCARTGVAGCTPAGPVDSCVPGEAALAEACNGLDDDCDGRVDEQVPGRRCYGGPEGTEGVGVCRAGTQACLGGVLVDACADDVVPRQTDDCNGLDDDCDGRVDEDFVALELRCGLGECVAEGLTACVAGQRVEICEPLDAAQGDGCDGLDEDCDGRVDEDFERDPIRCGVGACAADGVWVCADGAPEARCRPSRPQEREVCNGVDDDCDGQLDEGCAYGPMDLQALFEVECGRCHGPDDSLNLREDFQADTVGVRARSAPLRRIEPGDHRRSYLFHKLAGTQARVGGAGPREPRGGAFWGAYRLERLALFIDGLSRDEAP